LLLFGIGFRATVVYGFHHTIKTLELLGLSWLLLLLLRFFLFNSFRIRLNHLKRAFLFRQRRLFDLL
jgi:hypothetical protein